MAEEIKVVVVGEQGPSGQGVPNLGTTGQYLRLSLIHISEPTRPY